MHFRRSEKGNKSFLRSLLLGLLFLGFIGILPMIFPNLQYNSADAAGSQTNLQEESCRCCHGEHLPDRHHLLPGNECLACHEMVWNPETAAYEFAPFRDCRLCHQYESTESQYGTPDRHHIVGLNNGIGCMDCHPSRWDETSQSWYFGMLDNCDIPLYGTIEGQITDIDGNPLEGARITIPDHAKFLTLSDADGSYLLQDVYTKSYSSVRAQLFGYAVADSMPVTVLDGQTLTVDLVLTPVGQITGTVSDIEGNMLDGVDITTNDTQYSTQTDADGSFTLEDVTVGDYTVTAESYGFETETQPATVSQYTKTKGLHFTMTQYPIPEVCDDGIDNDMDGKTDCRDHKDCKKNTACWKK